MDNLYKRLTRKQISESVIALGHEVTKTCSSTPPPTGAT